MFRTWTGLVLLATASASMSSSAPELYNPISLFLPLPVDLVNAIGVFMGRVPTIGRAIGLDVTGDMTTVLCKVFKDNPGTASVISGFAGSPNGKRPGEECMKDNSEGSGPYKSKILEDLTLPNHTIYIPATPPRDTMPVIVWANGFCLPAGTMFANFLQEITSHGFMVIANGPIQHGGRLSDTTREDQLFQAIDWRSSTVHARRYGNIDNSRIIVAGQSCGGLNALLASADRRIAGSVIFNSGDFDGTTAKVIPKITKPIAWFQGGPDDFAEGVGKKAYQSLPPTTPALYASVDIGHIGYGGRFGQAAVLYLRWKFKGEAALRAEFCNPAATTRAGFSTQTKNLMC